MINSILVAGAGTMGSGIAFCAAQHGFRVRLYDSNEAVLHQAISKLEINISQLVAREKITAAAGQLILDHITPTSSIQDGKADLIIEAIIEKMEAKTALFHSLTEINDSKTIFASNTSSLSINTLQQQIKHPERVAGLHFFNPAQLMKLVEVVKGEQTAPDVIEALVACCLKLNKTPVICKDAPGFIVNRVARHYYLEAMKLVELNLATFETVDEIMESTGFKMGPFRLMDLIGMDINLAVSTSLYEAFGKVPRFQPSPLQIDKVAKAELGRKTGKGFYDYQK